MSEEFVSLQTAPKTQIQAAFEEVAWRSIYDLSFLHPNMSVYVSDSTLFEGQWTGCVTTPWMFGALIFSGPDQIWPVCRVNEKVGLRLPYGEMIFTVSELEGVSQYLSCSLMSPPSHSMSVQEGVRLADDRVRTLLSPPVNDPSAP